MNKNCQGSSAKQEKKFQESNEKVEQAEMYANFLNKLMHVYEEIVALENKISFHLKLLEAKILFIVTKRFHFKSAQFA